MDLNQPGADPNHGATHPRARSLQIRRLGRPAARRTWLRGAAPARPSTAAPGPSTQESQGPDCRGRSGHCLQPHAPRRGQHRAVSARSGVSPGPCTSPGTGHRRITVTASDSGPHGRRPLGAGKGGRRAAATNADCSALLVLAALTRAAATDTVTAAPQHRAPDCARFAPARDSPSVSAASILAWAAEPQVQPLAHRRQPPHRPGTVWSASTTGTQTH